MAPPLVPEGGLLDRIVFESFVHHVKAGLTALGWFNQARAHQPIQFRTSAVPQGEDILPNTLVATFEDIDTTEAEIGSTATIDTHTAWVDFYAQSDALGAHLTGDVRKMLLGQMPSIGYDEAGFSLYRVDLNPPDLVESIGWCNIEDVVRPRANDAGGAKRHWHAVSCLVVAGTA